MEKINKKDLRVILDEEFEEDMIYGIGKWNSRFGAWEKITVFFKNGERKEFEFDW